ncbi:urease accessory protein UreD [Lactobacillus sp. PV034]|uniref:urease accessory protein UreD n=1 Tax=Lactobacillus sp. PV034 TaxID=2594495 RepID=UPI00223F23B2|nr:urease accessory protein UreD [Lactobacillus sp. PV034]QNQ80926.1 urease accessory protein UreD [Lactobacillus sp. PV034]
MNEEFDGEVKLSFISRDGKTVAKDTYHTGNSRLSGNIPTTGDIPYYFLITTGGGYVEGEKYLQNISLDDNTHAILTTQAPNYVYKCENNILTTQDDIINVGKNSTLEFYADETIPYRYAYYRQTNKVNLKKGARLILTDGLTSGWSPDEKPFQYREVGIKTEVSIEDKLIYNDFLLVNPEIEKMRELGFFEDKNTFNSVLIIDENSSEELIDELRKYMDSIDTDAIYGISLLESNGLIFRLMGDSAHENRRVMWKFINYYRENIWKEAPINLRKNDHLEVHN